ncbi:MAG: hypothetical protein AB1921_09475 [Thermodesulfobacteriota bacterium]
MGRTRTLGIMAAACAVLGVAARIASAQNAFWLDELWSYLLVRLTAPSVHQIFFNLSHDNNHILNSVFLLLLGDRQSWFWYRAPSLVLGSLSIWLCALAAGRGKSPARSVAAILCSLSFAMILYSSEARGYAGAFFFGLCAFLLYERIHTRAGKVPVGLFWLSCCLGLLSQLSFVHVYLSLLAWGLWLLRREENRKRGMVRLAILHLPVLAFMAFLYVVHVRGMWVGGGPVYGPGQVLVTTLSVAMGGEKFGLPAVLAALAGAFTTIAALVHLRRTRDERFFFFLMVLFAVPVAVLFIARPGRLYFRYFVVCYPFLYAAMAQMLGDGTGGGRGRAALSWAFVAVFALSNLLLLGRFLDTGRGGYPQAVRFLAQNTPGPAITVGSDDDYLGPKMLLFYSRLLPRGKEFLYANKETIPSAPPRWFIIQPQDQNEHPSPRIQLPGGTRYVLVQTYPYSGFSGFSWYVYRRLPGPVGQ